MVSLYNALEIILNVIWFIMIAHIIMSWLLNFQVLNIRQPMVAQIWYGLNRLLEPAYAPIRRFLPNTPGLDLAPLVAFIVLIIVQRTLFINKGFFYGYDSCPGRGPVTGCRKKSSPPRHDDPRRGTSFLRLRI